MRSVALVCKRLVLVVGLVTAALAFLEITPAGACSCIGGTPAEQLEAADVVFVGELTESYGVGSTDNRAWFRFDVDEVFKGDVGAEIEVSAPSQGGASCGLDIAPATPFLVFAAARPELPGPAGELHTGLCTGSRPVGERNLPTVLGAGRSPSPEIPPPPSRDTLFATQPAGWAKLPLVAATVGAAVAAAVVALVLRRRSTAA